MISIAFVVRIARIPSASEGHSEKQSRTSAPSTKKPLACPAESPVSHYIKSYRLNSFIVRRRRRTSERDHDLNRLCSENRKNPLGKRGAFRETESNISPIHKGYRWLAQRSFLFLTTSSHRLNSFIVRDVAERVKGFMISIAFVVRIGRIPRQARAFRETKPSISSIHKDTAGLPSGVSCFSLHQVHRLNSFIVRRRRRTSERIMISIAFVVRIGRIPSASEGI